MKKFLSLALLAIATSIAFAADAPPAPVVNVETGVLDGAPYRIDMPEKWNGILLMYYHGYSEQFASFDKAKPDQIGTGFANAGFAVAQSGYSVIGFALEHAVPETEALREYTIKKYGKPKETYVMGHSMGGQLTMLTIESYPERYDGALPLCGLLQPSTWAISRGGALVAAFHYYYPGLLPGPVGVPTNFVTDKDTVAMVLKALPSNSTGLAELMALGRYKTAQDLADGVVFGTYIQRDFEQKLGEPVLDNHNTIYAGGPDDNALNDGVKRYRASDAALAYLKTWYTPTGVLLKPVLAVHTTYDPIIPAETVGLYADIVQRAGSGENFQQQYVKADGHCNIDGPQTFTALQELLDWKHNGKRPAAGVVPVPPAKK